MSAPMLAPLPAGASDDLVLCLYREASREVPVELRSTCPIHLDWRDRCAHLPHEGGE
ncbi:hypothetical protein M2164_005908 [Streptomyces sp. SAI-208]|uniref:hypothetical protein n=1 Tax=Streptomyces sp. SAI-208 TaxID=2940550 RepID=UPI0024772610|nr:hypothetical protein [Streptomyces sp. SAI-208]MDH6610273.1 hypothetical protein [Streptomyces sp. SAI-208]